MKKTLFWSACVCMGLASLLLAAGTSDLPRLLCLSFLICGCGMFLILSFQSDEYWPCCALSIFASCFHILYLYTPMSEAAVALAGAVITGIFALSLLFFLRKLPAFDWLRAALIAKCVLIPEVVMNAFLYAGSASPVYLVFSLAILLLTSCYAWYAIYGLIKNRKISAVSGCICAALEGLFLADLFACIYLMTTLKAKQLTEVSSAPASGKAKGKSQTKTNTYGSRTSSPKKPVKNRKKKSS